MTTKTIFLALLSLVVYWTAVVEGSTHVATAAVDTSSSSIAAAAVVEDYTATFHHNSHHNEHMIESLAPISLEGVELPVHRALPGGKRLYRNGHGLRSFSMYGLSLKMYVASMYSETPLRTIEQVLECSNRGCQSLLFEFTFLRSVGQGKVKLAWQKQLDWSVDYQYDGFEADAHKFVNMFGGMAYQGSVTVQFVGEETLVLDQGHVKGSIHGTNFQRAFLSMWFGDRAVQEDLKDALLGTSSQQEGTIVMA